MSDAGVQIDAVSDSVVARHRADSLYDRLDLDALWSLLRRRLRLFFYTAIIIFDIAALIAVWTPRQYTATAVVVLNGGGEQVTPSSVKEKSDEPSSPSDVETEMAIIGSRDLALKVVDYLHLEDDPDLQAMVRPKKSGLFGGDEPASAAPLTPEKRALLRQLLVSRLGSALGVQRLSSAYAFSVSITDTKPIRAAAIANAYAHLYTDSQIELKHAQNEQAVRVLGDRIAALKDQAQADFAAVQRYRIANNLLSTTGASLTEQEISAYNREVSAARAQAVGDQARLNTALGQLRGGFRGGDNVGEAMASPVIQSLRLRRAEISGRIAQDGARLGPRNPDLTDALRQLAEVDAQIENEISRVISNLRAQSNVSAQRLRSLSGSLGTAQGALAQNNRAMVALDDLQRRADASQALYESYLNRYKETVASAGAERADSRLVSDARIPMTPSFPRPTLFLLLGAVLGCGVGLVVALIAELSFTGLTTGEDVRKRIGVPYFGGIPDIKTVGAKSNDPLAEISASPRAAFAESVRGVLAKLRQRALPREGGRVTLISSALPNEGKTTVSACLAQIAAGGGERVIVVDCDAVRRAFTGTFGGGDDKTPGLLQVLAGEVTIASAIVPLPSLGCDIMPMRGATGTDAPRLDMARMRDLVIHLTQHYHLVILDTAPVLPVAETRELAALADDVVLVARWRHTPEKALTSAIELLPRAAQNAVGVVLSMINMKQQSRFARGDAGAFYASYKGYYHAQSA